MKVTISGYSCKVQENNGFLKNICKMAYNSTTTRYKCTSSDVLYSQTSYSMKESLKPYFSQEALLTKFVMTTHIFIKHADLKAGR